MPYYGCNKAWSAGRTIPDENVWKALRDIYANLIGSENSSLENNKENAFLVAYEIGRVDVGGGRGVFAKENIPTGTHVWNGEGLLAYFTEKKDYMKFIDSVHKNATTTTWICDMIEWSYSDKDYWVADLEDSAMINADRTGTRNVGCSSSVNTTNERFCEENLYALRDITRGEELRMTYGGMSEVR